MQDDTVTITEHAEELILDENDNDEQDERTITLRLSKRGRNYTTGAEEEDWILHEVLLRYGSDICCC